MPIVLDGKALADEICLDLKFRVSKLNAMGITPKLIIVTSGNNAASQVYVRNKVRRCEQIGIDVAVKHFDYLTAEIATRVYTANAYIPIIFQLPICGSIDEHFISQMLAPQVDADGFSQANAYLLAAGRLPHFYPCTPRGIMVLLNHYGIELSGKSVCVIGRSNIVGRPLARMMEQAGATVTVCHSETPDWLRYKAASSAEVVISATGRKNIIEYRAWRHYSYPLLANSVFVDVGINRDEKGQLCGDIDPKILRFSKAYTPVPGGIGPMTVAMLMENVVTYYERGTK